VALENGQLTAVNLKGVAVIWTVTLLTLTDFQNFFTARHGSKFLVISSLKIHQTFIVLLCCPVKCLAPCGLRGPK